MIDGERLLDVLHELGFDGEFVEDDTEMRIRCPLCADEGRRLYIEAETGVWLCFRCDERGSLFDLFNQGFGLNAKEAFEKMREVRFRFGSRHHFEGLEEEKKKPAEVRLPEEFIPFRDGGRSTPYSDYLHHRGVMHETRIDYGMGYCTEGTYAGRVIIPVYGAPSHTLYTFVARSIDPDIPSRKKVLYPPHSRPSETLFNLSRLRAGVVPRSPFRQLVLVEGVFDALRLPGNAVAILGSTLSPTQLELLQELGDEWRPFIICMDGDPAGRQASREIAGQLWSNLLPFQEAVLPEELDPGEAPLPVLKKTLRHAAGLDVPLPRGVFKREGRRP